MQTPEEENRPTSDPSVLARWPVVLVGALVLVVSAVWLSCQEYSGDKPLPPEHPLPTEPVEIQ